MYLCCSFTKICGKNRFACCDELAKNEPFLNLIALLYHGRDPDRCRKMAALKVISELILTQLNEKGDAKPNKVRKVVMEKLKDKLPAATWTDFSEAIEHLEKSGEVKRETLPDFSEILTLKKTPPKKRSLDGTKISDESLTESEHEAKPFIKLERKISVPDRFIPFLLRQSGQKLKNIELNSKTRIHCSPSISSLKAQKEADSSSSKVSGVVSDGDARVITIVGGEEKHLKTAQILVEKMLSAFQKNDKSGSGISESKHGSKKQQKSTASTGSTESEGSKKKQRKFY